MNTYNLHLYGMFFPLRDASYEFDVISLVRKDDVITCSESMILSLKRKASGVEIMTMMQQRASITIFWDLILVYLLYRHKRIT